MENTKTYGEIYIEDFFIKREQKGKLEGKIEVVNNMLDVFTDDQISIFTQLPVDKIVEIRKNSIDLM